MGLGHLGQKSEEIRQTDFPAPSATALETDFAATIEQRGRRMIPSRDDFKQAIETIIILGKDDKYLAEPCDKLEKALENDYLTRICNLITHRDGIRYHLPWAELSSDQKQEISDAIDIILDYLYKVEYNWGTI